MAREKWVDPAFAAAFILASVAGAVLAESSVLESGYGPWFPPAGLALGYLTAVGTRGLPVAVVARLAGLWAMMGASFFDGLGTRVVRAVVILGVYAVAANVFRRVQLEHVRLRELGWFVAVGVVAAPVAAFAGSALVDLAWGHPFEVAVAGAREFIIGDALAVATFTPVVLVIDHRLRHGWAGPVRLSRLQRRETAFQVGLLLVVPVLVLGLGEGGGEMPLLSLMIPPVVWMAIRRDALLAGLAVVAVNTVVALAAASAHPGTDLADLQATMLSASLVALLVAVAVGERQVHLADLTSSEQRYRTLVDSSPDLIMRTDLAGTVLYANSPSLGGAGMLDAVQAALGRAWAERSAEVLSVGSVTHQWQLYGPGERRWLDTRFLVIPGADGQVDSVLVVTRDVTRDQEARRALEQISRHDRLTGLPARDLFVEQAVDFLSAAAPDVASLVLVEVDGLGDLNAMLGAFAGDEVVQEQAGHLRILAGTAPVGRAASGEFLVALAGLGPPSAHVAMAQAMLDRVRRPLAIGGRTVKVTASMGLAFQGSTDDAEATAQHAAVALARARADGGDCLRLFDEEMGRSTTEHLEIRRELRFALERGEIHVVYQPIVDLEAGAVVGAEALARWDHPQLGTVGPNVFIAVAEELGIVHTIGEFVLGEACRMQATIARTRRVPLAMNVNVSTHQFAIGDLVEVVMGACSAAEVDPECLWLEITESALLHDVERANDQLDELRRHGVRIAVDDFGTGYGSLSYLRRLPVDGLKVDRSFVSGLPQHRADVVVAESLIGLGRALGLDVVAEGIEDEEQWAALRSMGCALGQGYLFGRPTLPEVALETWAAPG